MRIGLALRALWAVLVDASAAERIRAALSADAAALDRGGSAEEPGGRGREPAEGPGRSLPAASPVRTSAARSQVPARSDAITLLAALQREARLLDLVQEPLANYSDEQIGAAARDVLRSCAGVLERLFALKPVVAESEGADLEVPRGYDPLQYKLVGRIAGEPPFRGRLTHHGWIATRCELPGWSGSTQAANIIAPVEVEVD